MSKSHEGTLLGSMQRQSGASDGRAWKRRASVGLLALVLTGWWTAGKWGPACRDPRQRGRDELGEWMQRQEAISYDKILRNIGPAAGAGDGLVIASPSHGEPGQPDYFYTWTRDSALTYTTLLHRFLPERYWSPWTYSPRATKFGDTLSGEDAHDLLLEPLFRSFIAAQADLQNLHTPSGDLWSGGLNEPKFEANGTVFDGSWGRPQRDGPALRALTLIPYAHYLLDRKHTLDAEYVTHSLYDARLIRAHGKVIKNDLEEVARGWWMEGFDLWEEVNGHHLWTRLTSLRALQAGAILAARLNDPHAAEYYARSAERIEARLANFWVYESRHRGYWASSISGKNQLDSPIRPDLEDEVKDQRERSSEEEEQGEWGEVTRELDCGFVLSVLHAHTTRPANTTAEAGWTSFEPSHPGVLSTLRLLARSFDDEHPINGKAYWREGRLLGRYRGDEYDGTGKSQANPWFICTHAFAQALYLAHESFSRARVIRLSPHSSAFWSDILDAKISHLDAVWTRGDGLYEDALMKLWGVAEGYVRVARKHVPPSGEMSEQIDRINGTQRGARDLTWSHASFLDLARTRRRALQSKEAEGTSGRRASRNGGDLPMGWTDWLRDLY